MATRTIIAYTPDVWNIEQRNFHQATTLEDALHKATCLAGGWYKRAVTIDYQTTADNHERYMIRPSEVEPLFMWHPCYKIEAVGDDA